MILGNKWIFGDRDGSVDCYGVNYPWKYLDIWRPRLLLIVLSHYIPNNIHTGPILGGMFQKHQRDRPTENKGKKKEQ